MLPIYIYVMKKGKKEGETEEDRRERGGEAAALLVP